MSSQARLGYKFISKDSRDLEYCRCHSDMCFLGYRVSRTHIPRDACFPAHVSHGAVNIGVVTRGLVPAQYYAMY